MATAVVNHAVADFLRESTLEVFETMVFMAVEPGSPEEPSVGMVREELISSLGFTGTASGVLILACPLGLARTITANMLGIEEAEIADDSEIGDAMGEITNMIAGNVKNRWVALGNHMDLSIPVVAMSASLQANLGSARIEGARIRFALEDQQAPISVEMRLDDYPDKN